MKQKILGLIAKGKVNVAAAVLANAVGNGTISDEEFKALNKQIKVTTSKKGKFPNFPPSRGKKKGCNIPNGDGHW